MGALGSAVPPDAALCRWVGSAACADRLDLPWTAAAHHVTEPERRSMSAVCAACPMLTLCKVAADLLDATAAYWAGAHRDTRTLKSPEAVPGVDVAWVPLPLESAAAAGQAWEQGALAWPGLVGAA